MGAEFGGAIGIMYYLAVTVAGSLYLAGFAATLVSQIDISTYLSISKDMGSSLIAFATMMLVFLIIFLTGKGGAVKIQILSFIVMTVAFIVLIGGCIVTLSIDIYHNGSSHLISNFWSNWNPIWVLPEVKGIYY